MLHNRGDMLFRCLRDAGHTFAAPQDGFGIGNTVLPGRLRWNGRGGLAASSRLGSCLSLIVLGFLHLTLLPLKFLLVLGLHPGVPLGAEAGKLSGRSVPELGKVQMQKERQNGKGGDETEDSAEHRSHETPERPGDQHAQQTAGPGRE